MKSKRPELSELERLRAENILLVGENQVLRAELNHLRPFRGWRHVDDRPLINKTDIGFTLTEDGENEFIAAVPYCMRNAADPTTVFWWIRHCVIEEGRLCIVGDDYNEISGWQIEDVQYWMPVPSDPI